ncbi:hypothetical protein Q4591_07190 [Shewanella sp. 3_MG-2023]|uniref:hypothetical protein n=1 Tax=Shewanella sp. 3_MG-2023 TaxID=3062635 RepID=UPI0026E2D9DA|nr:hypothetical protein [Shewanella sp. 3_MG-2023]MDO6775135.1 hypothetical protein [Shewanella sp. 3_MG-2023]
MKLNTKSLSLITVVFLASTYVQAQDDTIDIGGSIKYNYSYQDYSTSSQSKGGDLAFNSFELVAKGEWDAWGSNITYRFMNSYDYLKLGYVYYKGVENWQFDVGLVGKPFGNRNYASHNWWYSLNYYLGFEDAYEVGAKATYAKGGWTSEYAFFKSAAYGASDKRGFSAAAYSGTINGTDYNNEDANTINIRQSYLMELGDLNVELGASLQHGQLYNAQADDNGTSKAYAAHVDANYKGLNIQLQMVDYHFEQYNDGQNDTNYYGMKMLNSSFEVASKGQIYTVNIAKRFTRDWGHFTVYNDYSMVTPDTADIAQHDTQLNTTGVSIAVDKFRFYVDHYFAKNALWLGDQGIGLVDLDDKWNSRVNVNMAYFF